MACYSSYCQEADELQWGSSDAILKEVYQIDDDEPRHKKEQTHAVECVNTLVLPNNLEEDVERLVRIRANRYPCRYMQGADCKLSSGLVTIRQLHCRHVAVKKQAKLRINKFK